MHHRLVRYLLCCFLLLYQWLPATAQSPAKYKEIDAFIKADQLKVKSTADIKVFGRELKRLFNEDEIKARAAFFWLTQHIKYDCEGLISGDRTYEPSEVLSTGKAVCSGYAQLFKLFCDELGLESEVINGFAFNYSDPPVHADSLSTNHAWNAVKIKGKWKLVDPTWGSGHTNNGCTEYFKEVNDDYFLADPLYMIKYHWPEDVEWQMLDTPYTAQQFADSAAEIKKAISVYTGNEPLDSVIKKKVGQTIRFRLPKEDLRNYFSVMVYNKTDSLIENLDLPVSISSDGFYYCDYKVKRSGSYNIYVSLYYFTGKETEFEGTNNVTYLLEASPFVRKKP
jgi:Transglutaminase-like superfamily